MIAADWDLFVCNARVRVAERTKECLSETKQDPRVKQTGEELLVDDDEVAAERGE
jgi:hypothetical protein